MDSTSRLLSLFRACLERVSILLMRIWVRGRYVGVAEGEVKKFGELLGLLGVVLGEEDLDELI
jgi:hypothetical protein